MLQATEYVAIFDKLKALEKDLSKLCGYNASATMGGSQWHTRPYSVFVSAEYCSLMPYCIVP